MQVNREISNIIQVVISARESKEGRKIEIDSSIEVTAIL